MTNVIFLFCAGRSWVEPDTRRDLFLQFAKAKNFDPLVAENWYSFTASEIFEHEVTPLSPPLPFTLTSSPLSPSLPLSLSPSLPLSLSPSLPLSLSPSLPLSLSPSLPLSLSPSLLFLLFFYIDFFNVGF